MDKRPSGIVETRQAYRDMMKVTDERLLMKMEELTIQLAQTLGQLLIRREVMEDQLKAINEAIVENRGASTLMKEIQDYMRQLTEARERERQANELKEITKDRQEKTAEG